MNANKSVKFMLIVVVLMASLMAVANGNAVQPSTLSVKLTNIGQNNSFRLSDSITLSFEIINAGSSPIGIFTQLGLGYQGGLILHVIREDGSEIEPPTIEHDSLNLSAMSSASNYTYLMPGHFFGVVQRFRISELVSKPGRYKLLAEYHCPVATKYAKVSNFWGVRKKSIISDGIDLIVEK